MASYIANFLYDYWWLSPIVFVLSLAGLFLIVSYEESRSGWRTMWRSWTDYLFLLVLAVGMISIIYYFFAFF